MSGATSESVNDVLAVAETLIELGFRVTLIKDGSPQAAW